MTQFFNRSSELSRRRKLRREMPRAEVILWSRLRNKQLLGQRFRRTYSVGEYVLDFYCPSLKLAIELDGDSHFVEGAKEHDEKREGFISSFGIHTLRFLNPDALENSDGVMEVIAAEARSRLDAGKAQHTATPPTPPS